MSCKPDCGCGCCRGTVATTPQPIYNRPGLDAIAYRIGTHGAFLDTMKSRLSSCDVAALAPLAVRTGDDPSIALLDGWATIADVLTFYQERFANEGYLRTATERRSVTELARLVGYEPRPGVASTVFLAYTIDENAEGQTEIPAGSRAQSVPLPGTGELPQSFETSEHLSARREWNAINARVTRPQTLSTVIEGTDGNPGPRLYLKGIATNLRVNDALLLQVYDFTPIPVRVTQVEADPLKDRTLVRWIRWQATEPIVTGPTQVRRALGRFQASAAGVGAATAFSRRLLEPVGEFLAWLAAQPGANPVPPDVLAVLRRPGLVEQILRPFERMVALAESPLSDAQLALAASPVVRDIAALDNVIASALDTANGGAVGAATNAAAAALQETIKSPGTKTSLEKQDARLDRLLSGIVDRLAARRSVPPRNAQSLDRDPRRLFETQSDVGLRAVAALEPQLAEALPSAAAHAAVTGESPLRVYALRDRAQLFGSIAPRKVTSVSANGIPTTEEWTDDDIIAAEQKNAIHLDASTDRLVTGSWLLLDLTASHEISLGRIDIRQPLLVARAGQVDVRVARAEYGISGQSTRILLENNAGNFINWFEERPPGTRNVGAFAFIRRAAVHFGSEPLALAEEPVEGDICGGDEWIETDRLVTGLASGRWLIVSGERSDVPGTRAVRASELVMLDSVQQYVEHVTSPLDVLPASSVVVGREPPTAEPSFLPGDRLHTYLKLARPLGYCYKRETVTIYANVVRATHGETRNETLGSGDGSQPNQRFVLRQPPLTFVPSPEPDGIASTLRVYVNRVEWHERDALVQLGPQDRGFMTRASDDGVTAVLFGDGARGARLPSGIENVTAVYRSGIGAGGNVTAGQISQLMTRPLGVKGVINPLDGSGGADRETRDQARRNVPVAVRSLDRVVSIQDYADFARTFAGIGKAAAAALPVGGIEVVHVTIAGANDIPIDETSDLYKNLVAALRRFGDPYRPFRVQLRERLMLALSARLAIDPDYEWEDAVDRTRARLLDVFGFERRDLGQSIMASEAVAAIHAVRGIRYVDIEAFGAVSQVTDSGTLRSPQEIQVALQEIVTAGQTTGRPPAYVRVSGIRMAGPRPRPAQLAFFVPGLPETLILNQIQG